jgi:hypothetical protein
MKKTLYTIKTIDIKLWAFFCTYHLAQNLAENSQGNASKSTKSTSSGSSEGSDLTLKLIQAWLFRFLFGPFFPF